MDSLGAFKTYLLRRQTRWLLPRNHWMDEQIRLGSFLWYIKGNRVMRFPSFYLKHFCKIYIITPQNWNSEESKNLFWNCTFWKRMINVCVTKNAWFYWVLEMWCCIHVTNAGLLITSQNTSPTTSVQYRIHPDNFFPHFLAAICVRHMNAFHSHEVFLQCSVYYSE